MADTIKDAIEKFEDELLTEAGQLTVDRLIAIRNNCFAEIKRIVSEARPPMLKDEEEYRGGDYAYDRAIDQYHTNLMKALGESIDK